MASDSIVKQTHLNRPAFVYYRQSDMKQVLKNEGSRFYQKRRAVMTPAKSLRRSSSSDTKGLDAWRVAAFICAVFLVAGAPAAQAGVNVWTTHGPYVIGRATVGALAIDPATASTLYAGMQSDGVFQSTDSGSSWTAVNTGLTSAPFVTALAIDPHTPSTLYAGGEGGVFKSTDSGATWSAANAGLTDINGNGNVPSGSLAIDSHTPSTLYAGTSGGGVFRSIDSGGNWSAVNTGLTNKNVAALAIDPTTPNRLYAGTDAGVFDIELTCVVGTGTSASCTEAALDACLPGGANFTGAVTFNCGANPATITVTSTKTISADTSIDGGSLITISGGNSVGVFSVNAGVKFTVQNLTIANSNSGAAGGGIANLGGTVIVTNSTFSGNRAANGGGIANGGGTSSDAGTVIVTNSTFSGNSAENQGGPTGVGGGIFNGGTLTVTNSTFSGNSASGYSRLGYGGGALFNFGTLTVTNSTFSENGTGLGGGAIMNGLGGTVTVTGSTFSRNSAGSYGGGIVNGETLTVTNSTFSGNSADEGGGIWNGGTLMVTNTIIANHTNGGDCVNESVPASATHNLISDAVHSCGLTNGVNGNLVGVDSKLDPAGLKDNGGPTQTIALLAISPAINAGDESVCAAPPVSNLDQRGYERPGTGYTNCSIGAYEYNSPGPPPICVGDCDGDGNVFVNEIIILVNIALGNAQASACPSGVPSGAEVNVTVIIQAVNAALNGCPLTAEQGCLASGGTVNSALCCASTEDFPNTCGIGACGCPPNASHEVRVCACGAGTCFNGSACVSQ